MEGVRGLYGGASNQVFDLLIMLQSGNLQTEQKSQSLGREVQFSSSQNTIPLDLRSENQDKIKR